ncbi:hypothetical protein BYT27DRAFT_7205998 [Phlegmacium glaucopus]|nr:hypothetical protein BYT27DRAFT_7205998 [Phlegmacium glaucopus]
MDDLGERHLAEVESSIPVSSLTTLTIEFHQTSGENEYVDNTVPFLRLFSLPRLASLNLRHVTFLRWKNIVNSFARHTPEYPALTSLTLSDMAYVIPTPKPRDYRNPTEAFPFLKQLSLDCIHSNHFIQHLLPLALPNRPSDPTPLPPPPPTLPWPHLRTLSVSGDATVSKPLLGRMITTREEFGVPFDKLYFDYHLTTNIEFWDWIMEKVDVELITNVQANWWFHSP